MRHRDMKIRIATAFWAAFFAGLQLTAADFTLKTAEQPVPKEIGDSIRALLQPKAIQLGQGDKPSLEIWFRQEVPLKSKPSSASESLNSVAETTLVGAIAVNESSLRDYKDNAIPKGVYTARFGVQPKDGDHLGTAEFDWFLLLVRAESDKETNGFNTFRSLTKASGKSTSSGHPLVVSLYPASGEGMFPRLSEPAAEHKALRVKLPAKTSAGEKSDLVFDLVFQGHGHIQ
jgi:hypothetical protein